jgi:hypothetical protein
MKWIGVAVLAIVGILAAIVAVEYLTVSIHNLPSWIPGHESLGAHLAGRGHYHKRGAAAALVAVVAFAGAVFVAIRGFNFSRKPRAAAAPKGAATSAGDMLASPEASAD